MSTEQHALQQKLQELQKIVDEMDEPKVLMIEGLMMDPEQHSKGENYYALKVSMIDETNFDLQVMKWCRVDDDWTLFARSPLTLAELTRVLIDGFPHVCKGLKV